MRPLSGMRYAGLMNGRISILTESCAMNSIFFGSPSKRRNRSQSRRMDAEVSVKSLFSGLHDRGATVFHLKLNLRVPVKRGDRSTAQAWHRHNFLFVGPAPYAEKNNNKVGDAKIERERNHNNEVRVRTRCFSP